MRQNIVIGLAGVESRSGCTHMAILIANYFAKKSYKTALVEMNGIGAFEEIRVSSGQKKRQFSINGVDYFPYVGQQNLKNVKDRKYEILVADYGNYAECNKTSFCNTDIPIFVSGSRPWETRYLDLIFNEFDNDSLEGYYFYFNFASASGDVQRDILEGMGNLSGNTFFLPYIENIWEKEAFPGGEEMLQTMFEWDNKKIAMNTSQKSWAKASQKPDWLSRLEDEVSTAESRNRKVKPRIIIGNGQENEEPEPTYGPLENSSDPMPEALEADLSPEEPKAETEVLPFEDMEIKEDSFEEKEVLPDVSEESLPEQGITSGNVEDEDIETTETAVVPVIEKETEKASIPIPKEILTETGIKKKFWLHFWKDKNRPADKLPMPDVQEHTFILKNLSYTNRDMQKALAVVKKMHKRTAELDPEEYDVAKIRQLSNLALQNLMCAVIRGGTLCKRETGYEGAPVITVNVNGQDISSLEERLDKILGSEKEKIILPYEDDYREPEQKGGKS